MGLDGHAKDEIRAGLKKIPDLERLIGRVQGIAAKRRFILRRARDTGDRENDGDVEEGGEDQGEVEESGEWVLTSGGGMLPPAMAEQQLRREVRGAQK